MSGLLRPDEGEPVIVVNENGRSPVVLVCEHAGNLIPQSLGSFVLLPEDLTRHIAWDIGAEDVARELAGTLDAPLLVQRYSRLVYDCNRPPESPNAMPAVSETTRIPGNEALSREDRLARIGEIYRPFHDRVAKLLDRRAACGISSFFVTIHSFTPVYKGQKRVLDLGVLHDRDSRFADKLIQCFGRMRDITVRRNQPYGPADGVCHTLNLHAEPRGLPYAMLEIRNDLIAETAGQRQWAERIAAVFIEAMEGEGLSYGT